MRFDPYPWQKVAIEYAVNFLRDAQPSQKVLFSAPTGVGKSVVILGVKRAMEALGFSPWVTSPRPDILDGMMSKLEATGDPLLQRMATPITLRNRLLSGAIAHPTHLLIDEGHHSEAESYKQLELLAGLCPAAAYTATPYRGSPASTRALREAYGEPLWLITYEEAAAEGYISVPEFTTLPLVDDDVVEVSGGEFKVTSIESATLDRLGDLAERSRPWYDGAWDMATMYSCPGSACVARLQQELVARGLPAVAVVADTPRDERRAIFSACEKGAVALLHIQVVCLAEDTPVLTERRGFVPIQDVTTADRVWDGVEWVEHQGCVYSGEKEVMEVDGVWMTEDQLVLSDEGWVEACEWTKHRLSGTFTADGRLSMSISNLHGLCVNDAPAGTNESSMISTSTCRILASTVDKRNMPSSELSTTVALDRSLKTFERCSTQREAASNGAQMRRTKITSTTVAEASECVKSGSATLSPSSYTSRRLSAARTSQSTAIESLTSRSTASTMTEATSLAMSTSLPKANSAIINGTLLRSEANAAKCSPLSSNAPSEGCIQKECVHSRSLSFTASKRERYSQSADESARVISRTYDLVLAGPRHRYQAGSLIVHNSEGVDLKIRRMVDLAPTLSPVRWVQQVGRVTRPWDRTPQVVCTNRNVMRHAYAMQGVVPISAVADSERAFPPTERAHVRALGLEAIGRFKPTGVKLSSGATVHMYSLTAPIKSENGQATVYVQYACLVHPTQEPAWFSKVNMQQGETRTWGTWAPCEPPQDLRGFASAPPSELSPKQRAWWERSAGSFGLAEQEVDRKKFSILPIMADAGVRFW